MKLNLNLSFKRVLSTAVMAILLTNSNLLGQGVDAQSYTINQDGDPDESEGQLVLRSDYTTGGNDTYDWIITHKLNGQLFFNYDNLLSLKIYQNGFFQAGKGEGGTAPAWMYFDNTVGMKTRQGSDYAFFGMRNRSGETGGDNEFDAIINWGDDSEDDLQLARNNTNIATFKGNGTFEHYGDFKVGNGSDDFSVSYNSTDNLANVKINTNQSIDSTALIVAGSVHIGPQTGVTVFDYDADQKDYLLWVEQGIVSDDLVFAPTSEWADYVFNKDYELMTLENLESFIKSSGHLPNVPSAIEVSNRGYSSLQINKILLEKIEELVLYTIDQEKEIKALETNYTEKIVALTKRIEALEKR